VCGHEMIGSLELINETEFGGQVQKIFSGEPWVRDLDANDRFELNNKLHQSAIDLFNFDKDTEEEIVKYKCDECGKTLIGTCRNFNGKLLCEECYTNKYANVNERFWSNTSNFVKVEKKTNERIADALEKMSEALDKLAEIDRSTKYYTGCYTSNKSFIDKNSNSFDYNDEIEKCNERVWEAM
jgi:hypothetical protein